jgi:hypothetical protein
MTEPVDVAVAVLVCCVFVFAAIVVVYPDDD